MKKVGIITISGNYNYGNRLQNYAMQEVYKKLGFDAETIWNNMCSQSKINFPIFVRFKNIIKPIFGKTNYVKIIKERNKNFEKFTNKYIKNSEYIINHEHDNNALNEMYDYFSVGSDQVWNYTFDNMSSVDFLKFADKSKTIAYAPSFGISQIPYIMKDIYIDGLNHIKFLSVREDAGSKIISDLVDKRAPVVLDPTMLLDKEDYEKIEIKPKYNINKKYILLYFLGNISEKKKKEIEEVKNKFDLDIINLMDITDKFHSSGPGEFLYLFHNAELILTDSFHACVFSIIYSKPFFVFDRDEKMSDMNSRLDTLLGMLKLNDRKISILKKNKNIFNTNYDDAIRIITKRRKESIKFITNSLEIKDKSVENIELNKCTGCASCMNVCPKGAISMKINKEGFKYPSIDKEKCTNCGLCKKTCPQLNKIKFNSETAYACYNKNKEQLLNSSSGGIFILLANNIIENNGIVIGAGFDNDKNLKHLVCKNKKDLIKLQGSKYLQSEINDTYKIAKEYLEDNKEVLFTGTPCQIAGLKLYLKKDYETLYTQDIVCHGCPSPKIFKMYLASFKNSVSNINFRNKPTGWIDYNVTLTFDNLKFYNKSHNVDKYMYVFLKDYCLRPSCYDCSFKNTNRISDITLADFWGVKNIIPEMFNNDGTSLVLVNTKKGNLLFERIKRNIIFKEVDRCEALKYNPSSYKSAKKPECRDSFMKDSDKLTFDKLYNKYYIKEDLKIRIKNRIKREIGR